MGRYVERVFTTLNSFFKYADRFIEGGQAAYEKYLEKDMLKEYVQDNSVWRKINNELEKILDQNKVDI